MLTRFATLAAVCLLVPVWIAPLAGADPDPGVTVEDVGPPPDNGIVASAEPGILRTPEGATLTVSAKDETQLPIPPLTTALSSREYLVGGMFNASIKGMSGGKGGTLQVGYQIGCGITGGSIKPFFGIGITPSISAAGVPSIAVPITGRVEVELVPGTVILVPVNKKTFKGTEAGVKLTATHIKIDGCVGQSFLRSYATLTASTTDTDTVISYYGVTKAV